MIIELHLLQSFPASNLNRDDVGQPKSVTFGGAVRGRISSQCLKRSARDLFEQHGVDKHETGVRTKRLLFGAASAIDNAKQASQHTQDVVRAGIRKLGFDVDKNDRTQYLLFVGRDAQQQLADYCQRNWDTLAKAVADRQAQEEKAKSGKSEKPRSGKTEKIKPTQADLDEGERILNADRVADIALFGRMVADNTKFNVNASSQVAHAVSTHAVATEFDYYTAVDDLRPDDAPGADMIGTIDFNAACYYRYANLDTNQLATNLADDSELTTRATRVWLRSMIAARPSGKQNSMAAQTMPETLLAVVRDNGSWNLANAFLKPIGGTDVMTDSTSAMMSHFDKLHGFYGHEGIHTITGAALSCDLPGLAEDDIADSVDALVDRTVSAATA